MTLTTTNNIIGKKNIVGLVLAGGAGARMQGFDKGLQTYQGKRLIDHVVERLMPQVGRLMVSANRNIEDYAVVAGTVISDLTTDSRNQNNDYQGPMAGIAAVADYLVKERPSSKDQQEFQAILISSCDTPLLPLDLCSRLTAALNDKQHLVSVAHDGKRRQNLHCLIAQPAWASLVESFEQGERAMYRWQHSVGVIEVDFSDQHSSFRNFNTLDSLKEPLQNS